MMEIVSEINDTVKVFSVDWVTESGSVVFLLAFTVLLLRCKQCNI